MKWYNTAYTDRLTGLKNRTAYAERIKELEGQSNERRSVFAVMIDVDGFKNINDAFGHHAGDEALKRISVFLSSVFDGDKYELFRIGGDEFAVIAIGIAEEELAERLSKADRSFDTVGCELSRGYTVVDFSVSNAIEKAFILADSAMYRVKQSKKKSRV